MTVLPASAGARWWAPPRPSLPAKLAVAWVVAALHVASYHAIAEVSWRPERSLMTALDERIPFLPWTVWLYMPLWIVFFHVVVASVRQWSTLWRGVASVALASTLAYVAFLLFPSSYPRPELFSDEGPSTRLLLLVWAVDRPNNTFPSLHVALPFVLALVILREDQRLGRWLLVAASLPSIATLTVKQHYAVDLAGGLALALVVHALISAGFRGARAGASDQRGPAAAPSGDGTDRTADLPAL